MSNIVHFQNNGIDLFLSGVHYVTRPKKGCEMSWQERSKWVGYNAALNVTQKEKLHNDNYESLGDLFYKLSKNCLPNERVFTEKYINDLRDKITFYISKTDEHKILFGKG